MDIALMRTRLGLAPHEVLTFGAPDRTGWMNVEVTDINSGDFRVVGQLKGEGFRPSGTSQATEPSAHGAPAPAHVHHYEEHRQTTEESWGALWAVPCICLIFAAFLKWPSAHGISLLLVLIALGWFALVMWGFGVLVDRPAHHLPAFSGVPPIASDPFTLPTVTCPGCGSPVSSEQCAYCGWVRPL